jgi:hypothetical protein
MALLYARCKKQWSADSTVHPAPTDAVQKPKGCTDIRQTTLRVQGHELLLMNADAQALGLPLSRYIPLLWRNWRSLSLPLRIIPPLPVDPWVPPSQRVVDSKNA